MTAKKLAKLIKAAGLPVKASYESEYDTDAGVDLNDVFSVQISGRFLSIVEQNDEGFVFHPMTTDVDALIAGLQRFILVTA